MLIKKDSLDRQIRISTPSYIKLEDMKYLFRSRSFSFTIEELCQTYHADKQVIKELQTINREYGDVIEKYANGKELDGRQKQLIKHFLPKKIEEKEMVENE